MKHTYKNPLVIINTALIVFLAVLALNANADRLHLPGFVKQALAAVTAITGSGTSDRLAAFAAANQIGDSIVTDDGSKITVGSGTGTTITTSGQITVGTQVNTRAIQGAGTGGTLALQGCVNCPSISLLSNKVVVNGFLEVAGAAVMVSPGDIAIAANSNNGGGKVNLNGGDIYLNNQNGVANLRLAGRIYTQELQVNGDAWTHGTLHIPHNDYAEWFEKEGDAQAGDMIGINPATGKARKYRAGDHFFGIYSTDPAIVANAQAPDEEMKKTHVLVGLLGQLDFDRSQTVIEGRIVKTSDGVYVGILLSNDKVLIGR